MNTTQTSTTQEVVATFKSQELIFTAGYSNELTNKNFTSVNIQARPEGTLILTRVPKSSVTNHTYNISNKTKKQMRVSFRSTKAFVNPNFQAKYIVNPKSSFSKIILDPVE